MERMIEIFRQRSNYIHAGFESIGLSCPKPEGAFYAFPSIKRTGLTSEEFTERLLKEQRVLVIPGDVFGE